MSQLVEMLVTNDTLSNSSTFVKKINRGTKLKINQIKGQIEKI
jgi:hypothetical protein